MYEQSTLWLTSVRNAAVLQYGVLCLSSAVYSLHYGLQTVEEVESCGVALLITYCFPRPDSYLLTYLLG